MQASTFKVLVFLFPFTLGMGSLPGCSSLDDSVSPPPLDDAGVSGATSGGSGGSGTGGSATGGSATGGSATGGSATGGSTTGGSATGGSATGGSTTGGSGGAAAGMAGQGGTSYGGAGAGGSDGGYSGSGRGGRNSGGAGMSGSAGRNNGGAGGSNTGGTGGTGAGGKFLGNITTGNSVDTGGMKFSKYWNQITPENAGKWGSVQSSPSGSFNWATLDAVYNYAQTNNIIFKQHTFVWGSQQPNGTPTLAQVENWIRSFCQRFPNTKLIDVVNEPPPHTTPNYTSNLGAGESGTYGWITKAFKLARQYCPNAVLILNDYNNLEYTDQENHFIDIVTQIKAAGAPIDAVGCQAHATTSLTATQLQNNLNTMASRTSLPIYITEWDINQANDQQQLATFQAQFPVFWNSASVRGITIWGWIVGRTWVPNSGLVNGTTPRPAMTWLMERVNRPVPPN
ncbi:MAG TPA: endo-1,4-beta-xylanase [Polyangiaceae bacterium]